MNRFSLNFHTHHTYLMPSSRWPTQSKSNGIYYSASSHTLYLDLSSPPNLFLPLLSTATHPLFLYRKGHVSHGDLYMASQVALRLGTSSHIEIEQDNPVG